MSGTCKEGKGWIHYQWPKQGQIQPSWKSTYVMRVKSPSGKEFARKHIADYKLPECITFIDALPKGATGKIDCKLLKQYDKSR